MSNRLTVPLLVLAGCTLNDVPPPLPDAGTSISDIRNPASPKRPPLGAIVQIAGAVVTNVKAVGNTKLIFVQDPASTSWAGITITFGKAPPTVAVGAVVTASGTFITYKGLEEIDLATGSLVQTGTANVPAPVSVAIADITTGGPRAMELQSMLVQVTNVTASKATSLQEFPIVDIVSPGPTIVVSSFWADDIGPSAIQAKMGDKFKSITGNMVMTGPTPLVAELAPGHASDLVLQ